MASWREEVILQLAQADDVGDASPSLEETPPDDDVNENEDLRCFVTFGGPEDGVLGLGLYVHTPTPQQLRAGLPPDIDLVGDYIDAEAFNMGIRRAALSSTALASEYEWWKAEPPAIVSSARGKLNGWLPLYINARHWARARHFAARALADLAAARWAKPEAAQDLRPEDALDVCCSLLTCAVVGFTGARPKDSSTRAATRRPASERAVQMYADVHRLLLQVAAEHPEVRQLAEKRIRDFIDDPAARTQESTPSLGSLVQCLLVAESCTWEELAPSLVPEALRRHAVRARTRGHGFEVPAPPAGETSDAEAARALVDAWDAFAPEAGLTTHFCIAFCRQVGRPAGTSLQDVAAAYDRRSGRLEASTIAGLMQACAALVEKPSMLHLVATLGPGGAEPDVELAAELILWACRYGRKRDTGAIMASAWPLPLREGRALLLRRWRLGVDAAGTRPWIPARPPQPPRVPERPPVEAGHRRRPEAAALRRPRRRRAELQPERRWVPREAVAEDPGSAGAWHHEDDHDHWTTPWLSYEQEEWGWSVPWSLPR